MSKPTSWPEFNSLIVSASNAVKGESFEDLTSSFLKWDAKYRSQLKHVWRLKEVPRKVLEDIGIPSQDQGIDLIAQTYKGKYWAIQCKYHGDTNKKISHREISTFLSLSNSISKKFDFCLVCTTADDFAKIYRGNDSVGFVLSDTWEALSVDFFQFHYSEKRQIPCVKRVPRPHQKKAIESAKKYFKKESRGKLIFPCGAGKSLTGYWISKELRAKTMIVAVPSLSLVKQTLEDYCRESLADGQPVSPLCVCSDEGIGKSDDVAVFTQDLGVPVTTNPSTIRDFLIEADGRVKVVFTTYQSANRLGEASIQLGIEFDLAILDEAHKTVGHKDKQFSYLLKDENIPIKKRVFMTATERRYTGKSDQILSMDDVDVYGDTFTQLTFKNAIREEILSDYRIITLVITKSELREFVRDNTWVSVSGIDWNKETDMRTLASLVALRKAMLKYPIKHAVSFHSSIKRAQLFKSLQKPFESAHPNFGVIDSFHVTGADSTAIRSRVIREFASSEKSIITNAKCLTEGVDVPGIDCVLFADPRKSTIDIVQAVGRALRKNKGKEFGYVLLPVFAESDSKEDVIESEDFQAILTTLRALASNDERIIEYLRERQTQGRRESQARLLQFELDEVFADSISSQELLENLELRAWDKLAKLSWMPFEEARSFVRKLGLRSREEYLERLNNSFDFSDLPRAAEKVYGKMWTDWPDFLGSNRVTESNKLTYIECKRLIENLNFQNAAQYRRYVKSIENNPGLPKHPYLAFKDVGWESWSQYLGVNKVYKGNYATFKEARDWAQASELKSAKDWKQAKVENKLPLGIPGHPQVVYKECGWAGWGDFLGTDNVRGIDYLNFSEARQFVRKLGLVNTIEWKQWSRNSRPSYIPGNPDQIYRQSGWQSWSDFLGAKIRTQGKMLTYEEAKSFVCGLGIRSSVQWREYWKFENKPSNIPSNPDREYKNKGWKGWGDFLGKVKK